MVSFTFDDIPKSAATIGAAILEEYDARGTFYVSGGLVGAARRNMPVLSVADALRRAGA
jgi:peptidoglycan/xylan/chitin deacetylase (PgdA/CDA1 family)